MTLRILYFATFRDLTGMREETISFIEGSQVKDLKSRLGKNHPELIKAFDSAIVAVNREFALDDHLLKEGDEVAIFPPVSGGSVDGPTIIRITRESLDMNALLEEIITPTAGAACVLTGVVQAHLERDELREAAHRSCEANTPMTEGQMPQFAREIRERWAAVEGVAIIQRIGDVPPGTPTVMIVCTAAHRSAEVFEAAKYGIDCLTDGVPILIKEVDPE
ncbi:MAG: molybdopterin converting factor subunit 1 [Anaerolineales bacterium]